MTPESGSHTDGGARPFRDLSELRLRELLSEVQVRVEQIIDERDRVDGLVDAMLAVTAGLDLDTMLQTIVRTATELIVARYGAWWRCRRRARKTSSNGWGSVRPRRVGTEANGHQRPSHQYT